MANSRERLHTVDALRGFALAAIALLHNLEHFDFYNFPTGLPAWLQSVDKGVWDTMFFLFAGKAYAIFALLFGLTFFIQLDHRQELGKEFRGRFAWRLTLLFCFGMFNAIFYQGDILATYAVIGFVLIPASYLNNTALFWLAVFMLLQPLEWVKVYQSLGGQPNIKPPDPFWYALFGKMESYIPGYSFIDTARGNLTNGKSAVLYWTLDSGRVTQTAGLFMLGLLAGRLGLFKVSAESKAFWKRILIIASIAFVPLFLLNHFASSYIHHLSVLPSIKLIWSVWGNLAFTFILVSGFFLLFQVDRFQHGLSVFAPLGRMSMTNYIMQSMLGTFVYYGWGLGLYQYTGASFSLLIGIVLICFQIWFSKRWLKTHKQGPFETLWHRLTWWGAKTNS